MLKQALAVLSALLIATVLAVTFANYLHPMTSTVASVTLTRVLDGTPLADDEPIDWGLVEPDTTYQFDNLTVLNTGNKDASIMLTAPDLPAGWALTWVGNHTILRPAEWVGGSIELYVASDAIAGTTYSWDCIVTGTHSVP